MKSVRNPVFIIINLLLSFVVVPNVSAKESTYQIGIDQRAGIHIEVIIDNLDAPGEPISVGQRFKLRAECIVDIAAAYGNSDRKSATGQQLNQFTNPNVWNAGCYVVIRQSNVSVAYTDSDRIEMNKVTSSSRFSFFEEVLRAESTDPITAFGGTELLSAPFDYTDKKGRRWPLGDEFNFGPSFKEVALFTPLEKKKTNLTPQVVELDGEEELDEEPILQVKRESTNSYLITILNYRTNYDVRIRATKKGNKTYTFNAKTDSDGDIAIRAKRNLKGYKLELIESGKGILSKSIPS
jgi:hypothetical protein